MAKEFVIERKSKAKQADPESAQLLGKEKDKADQVTDKPVVEAKETAIGPHYATLPFTFIWQGYSWHFKRFELITDQLKLFHLLRDGKQPIAPFESSLFKCPNPKCGHIFVGADNVVG